MPPTVSSLQDIIASINAAQAPQNTAIDQGIQSNEQSGTAQVAGLNQAKTNAFGQIGQEASNKGMLFSGFPSDAEARYTGSTYLPALAKLQTTIASTRDSLLGKKADLAAGANSEGLNELHRQQGELNNYNNAKTQAEATAAAEQAKEAQALRIAQMDNEAKIQAANIAASNRTPATPSLAEQKRSDAAALGSALGKVTGRDGFVSPDSYKSAKKDWVNAGYSATEFDSIYANYRNPDNHNYGNPV